jgi:hypothetical protein
MRKSLNSSSKKNLKNLAIPLRPDLAHSSADFDVHKWTLQDAWYISTVAQQPCNSFSARPLLLWGGSILKGHLEWKNSKCRNRI